MVVYRPRRDNEIPFTLLCDYFNNEWIPYLKNMTMLYGNVLELSKLVRTLNGRYKLALLSIIEEWVPLTFNDVDLKRFLRYLLQNREHWQWDYIFASAIVADKDAAQMIAIEMWENRLTAQTLALVFDAIHIITPDEIDNIIQRITDTISLDPERNDIPYFVKLFDAIDQLKDPLLRDRSLEYFQNVSYANRYGLWKSS